MGRVYYLSTGRPYMVVEASGPDESDIEVPLHAHNWQQAVDHITQDRRGRDINVEDVQTLSYGTTGTLLAVYEDVDRPPLLLVYED